jgi:hypothetical protein
MLFCFALYLSTYALCGGELNRFGEPRLDLTT